MGLFSWLCEGCGHPLLAPFNTDDINSWMSDCVAILRNGSIIRGSYDGYGRLDDYSITDDEPMTWHVACWIRAGRPANHKAESQSAPDQGHFFNDGDHSISEPVAKATD